MDRVQEVTISEEKLDLLEYLLKQNNLDQIENTSISIIKRRFFCRKFDQKKTQKKKPAFYSGETRLVEIRAETIFSPIGKKLKKLKNPIQKDTKKKNGVLFWRRFIMEIQVYEKLVLSKTKYSKKHRI